MPDRIWIARQAFERIDGIENVEIILYYEEQVEDSREQGYEVTEYRKVG
jgi:hypothetical protein